VVFKVGETANALPPAPPNRYVAPYHILLFVVQCDLGHVAPPPHLEGGAWAAKG
jgi:hypothetical protein